MDEANRCFLLETPRLYLREFTPDDASDLHEILGDAETMRFSEPAYTFEKTQRFLHDFCIGQKGGLAAVQKESGKVIGYILFKAYEPGRYELGWFFHRAFWRRGYAFEACSQVIGYAFRVLHAQTVMAETIDKERSIPLMEKLGMRAKGPQPGGPQPGDPQPGAPQDNAGNPACLYVYEIAAGSSRIPR